MKKILVALCSMFVIVLCSCKEEKKQEIVKWEYRTEVVWGQDDNYWAHPEFHGKLFNIPNEKMRQLGEEGWELVSVYTKTETVHPNFGKGEYVSGLQPNVRTSGVFYVFKRPKVEAAAKQNKEVGDYLACDTTEYVE